MPNMVLLHRNNNNIIYYEGELAEKAFVLNLLLEALRLDSAGHFLLLFVEKQLDRILPYQKEKAIPVIETEYNNLLAKIRVF